MTLRSCSVAVTELRVELSFEVGTELVSFFASFADLLAGKFKPNVPKAKTAGAPDASTTADAAADTVPDAAINGHPGVEAAVAVAEPTRKKARPTSQVFKHTFLPCFYHLRAHHICTIGSVFQAPGNDMAPVQSGIHRQYRATCGGLMGLLKPGDGASAIMV